jgi:serine protease inhibitor
MMRPYVIDDSYTRKQPLCGRKQMATSALQGRVQPVEVRVDRPFIYAIQHVPSGVCLFLGRVTDLR